MTRTFLNRAAVPWVAGSIAALLVLGPVLRPGVLFNLDLIVPPRLETPSGFWGLGPELPRRLPMWAVIAWLSHVIPATVIGKALMFAAIAVAWAGMSRMVEHIEPRASLLVTQGAAALYALSPFVLTRAVVGHFMVTIPHAMLPWLLPLLMRRPQRDSTVFLVGAALAATGHFGGSVALCLCLVGALCKVFDRPIRAVGLTVLAQTVWVVPGIVVKATNPGIKMSGTDAFPTHARGFDGLARLSAGGGFWNRYFQVGGSGFLVAGLGAVLLVLAAAGVRQIAPTMRIMLGSLGALGWAVSAASALGGLSSVLSVLNSTVLFGLWRDGQRLLTLHLLWLAPCAALGGARLASSDRASHHRSAAAAIAVLPLGVALALASPGLWGLGGQLAAERLPATWVAARSQVRADPGTVLVLPWTQYFNLRVGDGEVRRVLNPIPLYFGGDVLASSDNGLSTENKETADPRETTATALVQQVAEGQPASIGLGRLGVKWIVVLDRARGDASEGLRRDPSVRQVLDGDGLTLYRLDDEVQVHAADADRLDWHLPILATGPSTDQRLTLPRPASSGWFRGWRHGTTGPGGLLTLPAGSGPVWNAPAVAVLGAELMWALAVAVAAYRVRRVTSGVYGPKDPVVQSFD